MLSKHEVEGLARKAVAALIGVLLVVTLLSALLIAGLILILWATTAGLTPLVGQAGALAISGALCFLLLGIFFWRLLSARATSGSSDGEEPGKSLRERLEDTIRENPFESALAAFALGMFGQADARFRAMVLQGGVAFMRQATANSRGDSTDGEPANDGPGDGEPLGGEP